MSEYIFNLPDLGEGLVEAEIAEWMVKVGDLVNEEDPVGAMLTDKAAVELSSPVTGRVTRLAGEVGDTIAVGAPMIVFETDADQAIPGTETEPPAPPVDEAVEEAVAAVSHRHRLLKCLRLHPRVAIFSPPLPCDARPVRPVLT